MRCGVRVLLVSSNLVPAASELKASPGMDANGPDSDGGAIPRAVKFWMLKPSSTSQKALLNAPCVGAAMTSVTSSRPNVLLSTQNDRMPTGKGLSRLPEVIIAVPGKAVSTSCLKNGNGSAVSPVRLRYTPPRVAAPAATIWLRLKPS